MLTLRGCKAGLLCRASVAPGLHIFGIVHMLALSSRVGGGYYYYYCYYCYYHHHVCHFPAVEVHGRLL